MPSSVDYKVLAKNVFSWIFSPLFLLPQLLCPPYPFLLQLYNAIMFMIKGYIQNYVSSFVAERGGSGISHGELRYGLWLIGVVGCWIVWSSLETTGFWWFTMHNALTWPIRKINDSPLQALIVNKENVKKYICRHIQLCREVFFFFFLVGVPCRFSSHLMKER